MHPEIELLSLMSRFYEKKLIINGLPCYTSRKEGRGTLFSQGPARDCLDPDFYYRNGLEINVRITFIAMNES